jgi:hypothetical protein
MKIFIQSYRQKFISFESLLLAVGAIVVDKNPVVMVFAASIGVVTIWGIWYRIVRSRHLIVDYYKFSMRNFMPPSENSEEDYTYTRTTFGKLQTKNMKLSIRTRKKFRMGFAQQELRLI